MKKHLKLLVTMGLVIPGALCAKRDSEDTEHTGRSHLFIRPMFQAASPERVSTFRNNQVHEKEDGYHGAFQAVIFGSKTTNEDDFAAYFAPCGKKLLRVSENDDSAVVGDFDLWSPPFGVITQNEDFLSTLCLSPTHSEVGLGLEYRHSFWRNEETDRGYFFNASLPIMRVKNNLNLNERVLEDGGGRVEQFTTETRTVDTEEVFATFDNMRTAFNQKGWCFGRISCDSDDQSKTGVADIELRLGYEWLQHNPYHMETYIGLLLPTGTSVESKYLFEPVVGHGKHFGLMFGSNLGLDIWDCEKHDRHLRFELSNHSLYLFSKEQMRSIDLKGRPWSRYLPVYENEEQAQEAANIGGNADTFLATPGINVFTRKVDVKPGLSHTINSAFVFDACKWRLEGGYNFYARSSEIVELCSFPKTVALKAPGGDGETLPLATIDGKNNVCPVNTLENYQQSVIKEEDLDLASAASPALITSQLYAAVAYHCEEHCYPVFGNIGVSYEFSESSKAAPNRWGLWVKGGLSF